MSEPDGVRSRMPQANGKVGDMEPCEKQYTQIPFAHLGMERKRDLATMARGGQRFPLRMCCSVVSVCVFITVFLMPFLALRSVPTQRPDISWWRAGVVYHVYVRSFCDSNGDGVGDLRGVIQKLDYIQDLGVRAIQLSPIYESPMVDFGYDVSNHTNIDPLFGTLADFDELVKEMHSRGMKLIVDVIPNHTSNKHMWFQQSQIGDARYADYYIWADGKRDQGGELTVPNNWTSSFGGPAWTWHGGRNQFYYHRYDPKMPDLNYRNPEVIKSMQEVLEFWLRRGVDGLRVDAMEGLMENPDLSEDEPRTFRDGQKPGDYRYLEHIHTNAQPESLEILSQLRLVINKYAKKFRKEILMMPEVNVQQSHPDFWMGTYEHGGNMPTNKALLNSLRPGCKGHHIHKHVKHVMDTVPFDKGDHWLSWVSETHDHRRLVSRLGPGMAEVGLALSLLMPGTGFTYYGQEIGMADLSLTYDQTIDPKGRRAGQEGYQQKSRDPGRGPMQWNSNKNAGFSSADKTWLPVHADYTENNVEKQLADPKSVLNSYRRLIKVRDELAFMLGQHNPMVVTDHIYSFARINRGRFHPRFMVAMNVGSERSTNNYQNTNVTLKVPEDNIEVKVTLPPTGIVFYHSSNFGGEDLVGKVVPIDKLELAPGQVIVIKLKK